MDEAEQLTLTGCRWPLCQSFGHDPEEDVEPCRGCPGTVSIELHLDD